ncbi:serine hydrolase domain-containing protein [Bowmanella dokdonensis]|uniref:Beta-lactamase family protein n=1 Tax=Bowmanella dokdonensis TaxID=751969 RepID=A0A939IMV5_9ALTE|nr:serine hydrolase domain-containing protein [Bowmanella dokdonensis]MBN7825703.1 beta-lactamase family protein [Bowmanella dokdonensis]
MIRFWFAACLSCFVVSNGLAQDNWLGQFAEQVEQAAEQRNIPGYAFVVIQAGQPDQVFTYGKTSSDGEPVNQDTLFRLASVSKTFTSVLTAKLVEQGKLDWSLPLSRMAPDYPFEPELANSLTLGHILSQSSGYMPNAYDNLIEADYPVKRVLNELAGLKPICKPGDCYTYQNALFGVVSENLNTNLKQNYAELLHQHLLSPLGMNRASVGRQALIQDSNWAKPHVLIAKGRWHQVPVSEDYYRFAPAAGINASIRDMSQWLKLMLGQYPHLLSGHAIQQLLTPKIRTSRELYRRHWREHLKDAHYGLGWRLYDFDDEQLVHHSGWVKGYRADVGFSPKYQTGMVFLMNAEANLMNEITVNFWARFFEQMKSRAQSAP